MKTTKPTTNPYRVFNDEAIVVTEQIRKIQIGRNTFPVRGVRDKFIRAIVMEIIVANCVIKIGWQ
jgi:hypothetical protein